MLDAIITVLIEKLVEALLNEGFHLPEFHKQFKIVNEELQLLQSYIKQAERVRRKDQNEVLKTAVRQLRELLYDAEDIISDCKLFLERRKKAKKFKRYCSPSFLKFRYRVGKKLGELNQEIRNHIQMMSPFISATIVPPNQEQLGSNNRPTSYPILMKDAEVVGMENDVKKIKQWVLNPPKDDPLNIIGIVGMGGIGKTTLAQKIQNDDDVKHYFNHILMVTVSQTFKFEESIKNMLKEINGHRDFANIGVYRLLKELQETLERKKCLLILDDVWRLDESSWWESLKAVLVHSSSCVIVTTRDVGVARSMGATETHTHLTLSDKDSWSLFTKIAFSREGGHQFPNSELEHIGREICGRCGGLPLAIKVVGGMMKSKGTSTKEWERISKNLREELDKKGEAIFSMLQLSYDELPSYLKPCMLCLALYREDSDIFAVDIIAWWIGEGFVRVGKQGRTAYDIGREYLNELISRCLLVHESEGLSGAKGFSFRAHDMIREMIRRVAEEEIFICINDGGKSSSIQSRRVGMVMNTDMNLFISEEQTNFKSLRTIIVNGLEESEEFVQNLGSKLCQLKWLRVLDIRFQNLSSQKTLKRVDWLVGIGSLQHLVSLQIRKSRLEGLPDSIGNSQSLQILSLINCPNLKRLPKNIASLEKLSSLNLLGCWSLEFHPNEIENLKQLRIFNFTGNSKVKNTFHISGLKKFTQIRELGFTIDSEKGIEEGELKVLSELTQLERLGIGFPRNKNDDVDAEEKLLLRMESKVDHQLLSPLNQLSDLFLRGDLGKKTPIWLNPISLPNLRYLIIAECNSLNQMSPEFFGDEDSNSSTTVWKLEFLRVFACKKLELDWPRMQKAMPYLKFLEVEYCPNLKGLSFDLDEDGSGTWRKE